MQLLDEVVRMTGYKRPYAAWLLRNFGKGRLVRGLDGKPVRLVVACRNKRRTVVRPRKSDERVKKALAYLWDCFDQRTSTASIEKQRQGLDPLVLKGDIRRIQTELSALAKRKGMKVLDPGRAYPAARDLMRNRLYGPSPRERGYPHIRQRIRERTVGPP